MFKNYITIAFRSLLRHKGFSLINILGLAIGIAACLLIVLFITDEISFDRHHANKDRIYRVEGESVRGGQNPEPFAQTNFGLAPLLKSAFPAIESYVRFDMTQDMVKFKDKQYIEERIAYADSTFFDIFSYQFVKGNRANALDEPNSVVITEAIAEKYFGKEDPSNQLIKVNEELVKVTGVVKETPRNAHFHADLIVSIRTVEAGYPDWMRHPRSGGTSHYTYVLLPENYNPLTIESQFKEFIKNTVGENSTMKLTLQPLTKIHLYSQSNDQLEANGSISYVYVFAAVALIILVIACINYMNLTTLILG
jgi:putative ABC transport system permease protein